MTSKVQAAPGFTTHEADGISVVFDPQGGIISDMIIATDGGGELRPLHRAPWLSTCEELPDDTAPIERRLAGDFFCAPFAESSPGVPIHGWSANSAWDPEKPLREGSATTAIYRLRKTIGGANLSKRVTLRDAHPVIYQTHVFAGGTGHMPIAHHAMLHVPGGARLSFSPKASGRTPDTALETDPARGRSILAYPQTFDSLAALRRADGGTVDARLYPFDQRHEDLVILSEIPGRRLGWAAALAASQGFLFFALKDARLLPHTVLWMSNGGRFYPPWNGRHEAVIGIEEASIGPHLAGSALVRGLPLGEGKATAVRYAFGAIPAPRDWTYVSDIRLSRQAITLADVSGDERTVPFHGAHFGDPEGA